MDINFRHFDRLTDGGNGTNFWYMPKEADSESETAVGAGDRWDKGEKLMCAAGSGTPTAICGEAKGAKIKLGAASLAMAGSVALAAALAF